MVSKDLSEVVELLSKNGYTARLLPKERTSYILYHGVQKIGYLYQARWRPSLKVEGGITIHGAGRTYEVPMTLLHRLRQSGDIPVLKEGKGPGSPVYLDLIAVESIAAFYHMAKEQGVQPLRHFKKIYK